jgi:hypothetical protein
MIPSLYVYFDLKSDHSIKGFKSKYTYSEGIITCTILVFNKILATGTSKKQNDATDALEIASMNAIKANQYW